MKTDFFQNKHGGISQYQKEIVDFSANLNPLGMPGSVKRILNQAASWMETYPEQDSSRLQHRIAEHFKLPSEWVLCGNGSMELIYLLPRLFKKPVAVDFQPTFSGYVNAFSADQGELVSESFLSNRSTWTLPKKISFSKQTNFVFLCNPNNPTGHLISKEELKKLARLCEKRKTLLILDEAYIDLCGLTKKASFISEIKQYRYVGILRTFTKSFAIPGLRLGYLVGHPSWLDKLRALQVPWSVSPLAQVLGERLLKEEKYLDRSRKYLKEARTALVKDLKTISSIKVFDSKANFILARIVSGKSSVYELVFFLYKKKMLIRNCSSFRGLEHGNYFRVCIRKQPENKKLVQAMKEFFSE